MRLREISEMVREILETGAETLIVPNSDHALIQEVQNPQIVYRPINGAAKKDPLVPWIAFSFTPFRGLIEPFNIYPGRFWAMVRMHKQPSGLPEMIFVIARELPSASTPLMPDLAVSFSNSPRIETVIEKEGKEPAILRFLHRGGLTDASGNTLAPEYCIPGITEALPEGDVEDGIPGIVDRKGTSMIYLGDLVFYNQYRTPDRAKLRHFILNCVAVSVVARYVRDIVKKSLATEAAS
jgi:hypothetical protein